MTARHQAWDLRVTIGGTVTDCDAAHTSHGVDQPVGTATIDLPLPLPSQVDDGAPVVVEVAKDGTWLDPLFTGTFRDPDRNATGAGRTATLLCEGPNYKLTYPLEKSLAYAGGARAAPVSLFTTARHLGTQTISWYAIDAPTGTSTDATVTPGADSDFVWLAGRGHGTNSYDASIGDKAIKKHSKVLVIQGGDEIGSANLPVNAEQWGSMLDYTNDANWSDFEVFVAAPIRVADGDVTFRFVSGRKPGSTDYDEYEIKNVTWQTAGKTSVRDLVRGFYKRLGFAAGAYRCDQITDLSGATIYLGGNGLVDAGQVRIVRTEQPIAWITRVVGMFGFAAFDCPDGVPVVRPYRGVPSGTPAATFTEDEDCFAVRRPAVDPSTVYNAVRVEGASGTDQNRKRFAYVYETASPASNPLIPTPPGVNKLRVSNSLLTSTALCQQVGLIAEANNEDRSYLTWETWPHALAPASVVSLGAPTVGFSGNLFLERIAHDLDTSGFRSSLSGWAGVATAFTETPDPDPTQIDAEPTDPRPATEWRAWRPSGEFS